MEAPSPQLRTSGRTPKLTYRTKSVDARQAPSTAASSSPSVASVPYASSQQNSSETMSQLQSRRPSTAAISYSSLPSHGSPKKRSSFFSGLFAKEPSAQALVDYQKQILRSQSHGRSQPSHIAIAGVSSAQLPPNVPKVNSKWDGVPPSVKEREKQQQLSARKSMSIMAPSIKPSVSGDSDSSSTGAGVYRPQSQDTLGSMSTYSSGSGNKLAELYGWERSESLKGSNSFLVEPGRPCTSRSASSNSAPAQLQRKDQALARSLTQPELPRTHLDQLSSQPLHSPALPDHSHSPSTTPFSSSPATPDAMVLSPIQSLASPQSSTTLQSESEGTGSRLNVTTLEVPTSVDEVIIRNTGVNILGPPLSAKQKAIQVQTLDGGMIRPKTSGTLHRSSASTNTPTSPPLSTDKACTDTTLEHRQRSNSARNRLNLGVSLKHQAVAPWTWSERHSDSQAITNDSGSLSPSPAESGSSSRRKRLTLFKK